MKNTPYKGKVVIITGGSSGIGLALAHEFAREAAYIVLVARDRAKLAHASLGLEDAFETPVKTIAADVGNQDAIASAIRQAGDEYGRIDVLINCAGATSCGRFADQPVGDLEKTMRTNYLGALYASKAAWPYLKKAGGQLSFVSSVAGYMGLIGYSSYAPTKFALTGLAECLRMEGADDGIRVSVIFPPDTNTPMLEYEKKHGLPETLALSANIKAISAEKVAAVYIRGLQRNKKEIYCDRSSSLLRLFKAGFPGLFYYLTKRVVQKARKIKSKQTRSIQ